MTPREPDGRGSTDTDAGWDSRYSRQSRFVPLGREGQQRLRTAEVLLVGVGALGCHLALSLVRAGVGRIWLVDRDVVEEHNLPRQILFDEEDARRGTPKAEAAAAHLRRANAACDIIAVADEFGPTTLTTLAAQPDLLLDGTDNFATRYVINDLAVQRAIPWIYGAAVGSEGMAMAVLPGRTACLRCILPTPPASGDSGTCETDGILQPVVAMVTAFQAAQAIKILAGHADDVARGVFAADVWRNHYGLQLQAAAPNADCESCALGRFPALTETEQNLVSLCGRDAVQVRPSRLPSFDLDALADRLARAGVAVERTPHLLRFAADRCRFSVFPDGRALVFGEADGRRAMALYDRWIGAR
ncbi:MAG: ThiF family adenylyltransferase [Planctomycetota bacterium]